VNQIGLLESGVIRGLLVALGSLLGLVMTKAGLTFDDAFYAQLTDAVLMLLIAGSTLYAAWMRANKANPPITKAAEAHTEARLVQETLERNGEGGFARVGQLAAIAVLGLLGACSIFGMPGAKSFNERLAVGYSTVTTVRQSATTLVSADVISPGDAANVQQQADNARAGLDIARTLTTVDPKAADARLVASLQILTALEAYLRSRQP
jgi:hypothetical protein